MMIIELRERREEGRGKKEDKIIVSFSEWNPRIFFFSFLFFSSLLLPLSSLVDASAIKTDFPTQVCFRDQCLTVEIAGTDEERSRGLQNRASLPEGEGMLFIFPFESIYRFWMKETLISLDMIWINSEREVVGTATDVPPCQEDPCPQYGPSQRSLYVLEANAGFVIRHDIKIGDKAVFR